MGRLSTSTPLLHRHRSASAPLGGFADASYLCVVTFNYTIMARSNMFLGLASGKIGDVVYSRSRGQQIARVRVVPNNPRTSSQQAQRVRMAAVAALYRAARPVLKDSFTIRHGFESSYNAFSRNAIGLAPFFTKQMVANCLALPIPAQASRGVLPPVVADISSAASGSVERMPSFGLLEESTVGQWSEAFIRNNPSYKDGDKVTFVAVYFNLNEEVPLVNAYNANVFVKEIVLDTASDESLDNMGWYPSEGRSFMGAQGLVNSLTDDGLLADDNIIQTAVIGSSKGANGELLVSSEYFTLNKAARDLYDEFRTDAALQSAINSYGAVADSALSV